ncbi:MAG: hypothetical protein H7246_16295 [Phycisphaerae bacterium]|nr:hypothetical protein [Saprospiraceae bacterium]
MNINNIWKKIANFFISAARIFWSDIVVKIFEGLGSDQFLPFVSRHFFYLLWILLVPIVLYTMAQGREFFMGLFDDSYFFSGFRASFLMVAYFAQAMAIILLPRPFFKKVNYKNWGRVRSPIALEDTSLTYLLSALPVILYGIVMIVVQADRIDDWWKWAIIAITLIATAICASIAESRWRLSAHKTLLIILVLTIVCGLTVGWIPKNDEFWNYFTVGVSLLAQTVLIGGLSRRINESFRNATHYEDPSAQRGSPKMHRYDWLYLWTVIPITLLVIVFAFCSNLEAPAPVFMLLLLTTFYMIFTRLMAAWFIYSIRRLGLKWWENWRVWVFWGVVAPALGVIFFLKSGIHDVRTVKMEHGAIPADDRLDLDQWFDAWWAQNQFDTTAAEIPIYLVAVQGGGSRAALWASEILNCFEIESNYQFHKHCFAISSASGGSVGTGAALALWRFAADNDVLITSHTTDKWTKDTLYANYARGAFHRNYLSGSFYEMFICEIAGRFAFNVKDRDNRNYRLQKDEALGFAAGLKRGFHGDPNPLNLQIGERLRLFDKGDAPMLRVDDQLKVKNYPFMPYLSYWYEGPGKPKTSLPLYLPISTNLQTGKAGFSSPVKMDSIIFTDAIDILDSVESWESRRNRDRTLSLVGATNLSELFPVMSAYTHIPGTGNFIDGGTFENMGLQVMQQIYFWLDKKRNTDRRLNSIKSKIRIRVVYVINHGLEAKGVPDRSRVSQITSPLKHASSTTIDGRTTYFTKRMAYDLQLQDTLHTILLQGPKGDSSYLYIPLGRWLSQRSIRLANERADKCKSEIRAVVAPIK